MLSANPDKYTFFVPEKAHWSKIRHLKTNVGTGLNKALEALEDENIEALQDVLKHINFNRKIGQRTLDDDSLDLSDAVAKVKALINEHLIDLGIAPKIPPVELLSPDFLAHVRKHAGGDPEAKASEMEHAIRKHCTVHFDEDPAFYKRMSDKLEHLIQAHKDNWSALAEAYEQLRDEALAGRKDPVEGLTKEATTFYDYVLQLAFDGQDGPVEHRPRLKTVMARIVEILQETIDIIDFWKKPIEVKKLRGSIDTEILLSNIPELVDRHERIVVEIVKLAEKRHKELTA
ncbi:MAG TPA: type I restriction-modification system subunit M N-terminal domain-containing protein [Nitrospira sp.]|nr:type I restriction-modification system subunit M N-terminal domain-containing protein [Nitrospira sp.]